MDKLKLIVLVENLTYKKDILAEHGFSVYIETPKANILFDTGAGNTLMHNAGKLHIDISKIKYIVLSHGHYDHTGGINSIIRKNNNVKIFAHPDIFKKKFVKNKNFREIGIPLQKEEFLKYGVELKLSKNSQKLTENIWTSGEIPANNDFENIEKKFFTVNKNN